MAHASAGPQGTDEANGTVLDVGAVVLAHDGADGIGGLVGVVKGNRGHVVVQDVGLDDAVQQVTADEAHLTIDGGGSATDKVPLLGSVVRQRGVGVLQEGDGNCGRDKRSVSGNFCNCFRHEGILRLTEPVVDPKVWDAVPDGHVVPAKGAAEVVEGAEGEDQANVADEDVLGVLGLVQRAGRVKVVDTAAQAVVLALATALTLALVEVVAGDVGEQVVGPADELLHDQHEESVGGRLLGQLRQLVDHLADASGVLLAGPGEEDHVALHVAGGGVMLVVGDFPAEVGDQQGGVEEPAGDVVDEAGVGKGAVAALVGNNPEAGAEEALHDGVDGPESAADGG